MTFSRFNFCNIFPGCNAITDSLSANGTTQKLLSLGVGIAAIVKRTSSTRACAYLKLFELLYICDLESTLYNVNSCIINMYRYYVNSNTQFQLKIKIYSVVFKVVSILCTHTHTSAFFSVIKTVLGDLRYT